MKYFILSLMIISLNTWAKQTPQFDTYKIESGTIGNGLKVTGKIVPVEGSIYIESARFTGRVLSVLIKEGDYVQAGTKLVLINSAECLSLYQEKKMAQDRKLDDMLKTVESREKQLSLKVAATTCHLVASQGGVITKKMIEAGSNFNSGDNLFTFINRNALTVELDVPERDAHKIKFGQRVIVKRPSDTVESYTTTIDAIIPSLSSVSRTVKVKLKKINFKQNPSLEEFVFGEIEVGGEGLFFKVPSASVVFAGDIDYILKMEGDQIKRIPISIVNQGEEFFHIREKSPHTIHIGDTIISKGAVFQYQAKFKDE